jgi:dihydropteroate synthase
MTINCKGKKIDLSVPKVMGILNITPDSFYDGGRFQTDKTVLSQTEKMLNEGATFIDIGAYSSRPNAKNISEDDELQRVVPMIKLLCKEFPEILISIDTFRAKVAKKSISAGACMINDISGGNLDKAMFQTVADYQVPYILMHMKGNPQNMQDKPSYNDLIKEVKEYFKEKIQQLEQLNVQDIILDMGFGFSKTMHHNYDILQKLEEFQEFNRPVLAGMSRKSMLYKLLDTTPKKMLNATTIVNTLAIEKGVKILRVHDVKEALECVKIVSYLQGIK